MSDDYWKNKRLYDKYNRTAEKGRMRQQVAADPPKPSPPIELMTFATPQEEIEHLRALAFEMWKLFANASLLDTSAEQLMTRTFYSVDKHLRALGIVGPKPLPKKLQKLKKK